MKELGILKKLKRIIDSSRALFSHADYTNLGETIVRVDKTCPSCKGDLRAIHTGKILTTCPPKYPFKCRKCDKVTYLSE